MPDPAALLNRSLRARALYRQCTSRHPAPLHGLVHLVGEMVEPPATLLCVCPVTPLVVRAALHVAAQRDFPLVFAATLNQVDRESGYTGWSQADFCAFIERQVAANPIPVPVFVGLDHGGPWCKDGTSHLALSTVMAEVKASIEACLRAGYSHFHIDATLDPSMTSGSAQPEAVLLRTVALIVYTERCRIEMILPPVSYEVSAEREEGVPLSADEVVVFTERLHALLRKRLPDADPPLFTVANLGTDLHSPAFDAVRATRLSAALGEHNTYLKGHFTDFVAVLHRYPAEGVMAANIGPELAAVEFNQLRLLSTMARRRNRPVAFESVVVQLLEDSGRWRKWLEPGEKVERLHHLPDVRLAQILDTASRYVLTDPRVERARARLYEAVAGEVEPETFVFDSLCKTLERYSSAFNLDGLAGKLMPPVGARSSL